MNTTFLHIKLQVYKQNLFKVFGYNIYSYLLKWYQWNIQGYKLNFTCTELYTFLIKSIMLPEQLFYTFTLIL